MVCCESLLAEASGRHAEGFQDLVLAGIFESLQEGVKQIRARVTIAGVFRQIIATSRIRGVNRATGTGF